LFKHSSQKGLFKKPDWDIAGQNYERAGMRGQSLAYTVNCGWLLMPDISATAFKVGKSYEQAVQAYTKASEALLKADA
jgi:hypothetical protein